MIRFRTLRRLILLALCLALIVCGVWLFRPVFSGGWPDGRVALVGAGMIGIGIGVLWTDFIEAGD